MPKTHRPKEIVQINCSNNEPIRDIFFILHNKKKKLLERKKVNYYSSRVGSVGVMGVAPLDTSATVVVSSITFSAVALEG